MSDSNTLIWNNELPISSKYDDVYFDKENGLKESQYVFLEGNNLREHLSSSSSLVIAETGFGTGLNFISTVRWWKANANPHNQLHYISVEKHPLSPAEMKRAFALLDSEHQTDAIQLISLYPAHHTNGFHQILYSSNVTITLLFGDANYAYSNLLAKVDAWYLDGFAPSKNPEMWSPELFAQIGRLSKPGTTFSTFTAAGIVRRGLQAVGFDVRKQKGFGRKREMLVGTFTGNPEPEPSPKPWFDLPESIKPDHVAVIGGGLAGCSTAYALAKRGVKVTLIEQETELATGGSGNPQGALYAKLPVKPTNQGELHITGLLHTLNLLKKEDPEQSFWNQSGVVQLATSAKEEQRQHAMIENGYYPDSLVDHKSKEQLAEIIGTEPKHLGLYFPEAGWVSPKEFCQHLSMHENIEVIHTELNTLEFTDGRWSLRTKDEQELTATHVVVCAAEHTKQFDPIKHLPLKTIRGQVSIIDSPETTNYPNSVVCGEGYISPARNGKLCFGATFDLRGTQRDVTTEDHQENLSNLADILPELAGQISQHQESLTGRTAFRCSTPDYMPIVGPAPVYDSYLEVFSQLRKDRKWNFDDAKPEHYPNLYINTGHGSKGLITCPVSAELLAAMLCDEPLPLPKNLIDMINPCRFIIKNLIKQAI